MDQFASDLVRDLAIARLLITQWWELLDRAGALWRYAPSGSPANLFSRPPAWIPREARVPLQAIFDDLALWHGARWPEVPLEAMLTLGTARAALTRAWPALLENDHVTLRTLLRIALQRYGEHGFMTPRCSLHWLS